MISHLHHINFLVRDLNQAVEKYRALLGSDHQFQFDELEARGVRIARTKLGQTWLVLVQPTGNQGIPAEHLKKHGEGFFLMSLACNDLDSEITRLTSEPDIEFSTPERRGLDNWRIRDLEPAMFGDVQIQLTEDEEGHG